MRSWEPGAGSWKLAIPVCVAIKSVQVKVASIESNCQRNDWDNDDDDDDDGCQAGIIRLLIPLNEGRSQNRETHVHTQTRDLEQQ